MNINAYATGDEAGEVEVAGEEHAHEFVGARRVHLARGGHALHQRGDTCTRIERKRRGAGAAQAHAHGTCRYRCSTGTDTDTLSTRDSKDMGEGGAHACACKCAPLARRQKGRLAGTHLVRMTFG